MRFIRGHAIVHVLSPVNMYSDGIHISLALVRTSLLRVGQKGGWSPHTFTPTFWCVWHLPIGFVLFYKVHYKHLGLSVNNLIPPLHYWVSPFQLSLSSAFRRRLRSFRKISDRFITGQHDVKLPRLIMYSVCMFILNIYWTYNMMILITNTKYDLPKHYDQGYSE